MKFSAALPRRSLSFCATASTTKRWISIGKSIQCASCACSSRRELHAQLAHWIDFPIEIHRLVVLAVAQKLKDLRGSAAENFIAAGPRPLLTEQLYGNRKICLHRVRIEDILALQLQPEI